MAGQGFQLGDVHVFPVLDVTQEYDSNIALSDNSPISSPVASSVTRLSPSLNVVGGTRRNYFGLQYKLDDGRYWSSSVDNYTDHFLDAFSHNEFSKRARLDVGLNYTRSHDQRGSTFTGIIARLIGSNDPDQWHQVSIATAFEYGREGAKMKLAANGSYAVKRYDNNRLFTRSQDVNNTLIGGTLYYRVRSHLYFLFEPSYDIFDYRQARSPFDSQELTLFGGATWEATAKTTGTIKVGWQHRKLTFSDSVNSGLSWDAAITWNPSSNAEWQFNTSFAGSESSGASGSFVQALNNELNWSHQWGHKLKHEARFAIGRDKFIGTTRIDHLTDASASLVYNLKRWLEISAGYAYSKRSSNQVLSSYKQHVFSLAFHIAP
ncbi:MAG: outer membrane beta-barrel protein [Mariprofundaceae bacterium]